MCFQEMNALKNKTSNGGNRNEKDYVALEQGHLHYGNGSRSLEREQHLWLYGISAGCPGIAQSQIIEPQIQSIDKY